MFILSTLGILAIGPIIATGNQGKEIYYWAVQFFLHFQFNGWFWFAAMAIGARWAERQGFALHLDRLTDSASGSFPPCSPTRWPLHGANRFPPSSPRYPLAVALQVWAAWRTFRILRYACDSVLMSSIPTLGTDPHRRRLGVHGPEGVGAGLGGRTFGGRHGLHHPPLRHGLHPHEHVGDHDDAAVAYAVLHGWCDLRQASHASVSVLLVAGIILSELLLFAQGTFFWAGWGMIPGHYWHLFLASALMPVGVGLMLWSGWRNGQAIA